jgi:cytochrome b561
MSVDVIRYHPMLVALHWLIAILIIGNLAGGKLLLESLPDTDPQKLAVLRLHMLGGLTILLLLVGRLVTRFATKRPRPVHERGPLRWLAAISHAGLYLASLAMAVTGLGMAQLGGLFPLLEGKPVNLPEDWSAIAPHAGHQLFANVMLALIALHFAGALYHMAKRDGTARRMWFGQRSAD